MTKELSEFKVVEVGKYRFSIFEFETTKRDLFTFNQTVSPLCHPNLVRDRLGDLSLFLGMDLATRDAIWAECPRWRVFKAELCCNILTV